MSGTVVIDGVPSLIIRKDGEAGIITKIRESLPSYTGTTTVTPSTEIQVLRTANKSVYENITVEAIPSNYGLITWDGHTMTVS